MKYLDFLDFENYKFRVGCLMVEGIVQNFTSSLFAKKLRN